MFATRGSQRRAVAGVSATVCFATMSLLGLGCGSTSGPPPQDAQTSDAAGSDAGILGSDAATAVGLTCSDEGLPLCSDGCDGAAEVCVGLDPATACCRAACDEAIPDDCGNGFECRSLVAGDGSPIGMSACFAVQDIGEPCSPERCPSGALCVGNDAGTAFCREACDPTVADSCATGTACTELLSGDPPGACLPAGDVGDECSPEPCLAGTVCTGADPDTAVCRLECDPTAMDPGCAPDHMCVPFGGTPDVGACLPNN